ncbi:hypothetical protein ACZ90_08645 [Streptomyces albus subsp. albus]|nr:hypothetical protein ACZ90_08645 [Streptomyces albus subsp. albus]
MTSTVAAAVAVLALTLTGCGGDDKDDSGAAPGRAEQSGGRAGSAPPAAGKGSSSPGAHPSAGRTGGPKSPRPAPSRTPIRSQAPAGTSGGTSGGTGGASGGATSGAGSSRPAGVQGVWYSVAQSPNGQPLVLTVNGGSFTVRMGAKTLNGTISAGMAIRASYGGDSMSGTAALGNGGQRLSFNWNDGSTDIFARTKS